MIRLEHPRVTEVHLSNMMDDLDPESTTAFQDFMDLIKKHSLILYPKDNTDEENPQRESNKFRGDVFEIFTEHFCKFSGADKRIDIDSYKVEIENDLGVDGYGVTVSTGEPTTVQCKFKSNPYHKAGMLTLGDLKDFMGLSFGRHKAAERNQKVITTAANISYRITQAHPDMKIITIDNLRHLTDVNVKLWEDFKNSIALSAKAAKTRQTFDLYKNQQGAKVAIDSMLRDDSVSAGQIIQPTGAGKTLNEFLAAEECFSNGGKLVVVSSPRIGLTEQLMQDFYNLKRSNWTPLIINSGNEVNVELYHDESKVFYKPTTDVDKITQMISDVLLEGQRLIVFTTNHSLVPEKGKGGATGKALARLADLNITPDLYICDEAHNLTRTDWQAIFQIEMKKSLFFTATRRVSYSDNGLGMNNLENFGEVLYKVSPSVIIKAGIIVPPRLHLVHSSTNAYDLEGTKTKDKEDLAMTIASIQEHMNQVDKYEDNSTRLIVFCKSAGQAHRLAKAPALRKAIPTLNYVNAITSHTNQMTDTRKNILEQFQENKNSVLFHYDVISEGIDLKGTTGVVILRPLRNIKATQGIGRALRLQVDDRAALKDGTIKVGNVEGWNKPFGWVIIPYIDGQDEDTIEKIKQILHELRSHDYDVDVETIEFSDTCDGGSGNTEVEFKENVNDEANDSLSTVDLETLGIIIEEVDHIIEKEDMALLKPVVTTKVYRKAFGL